MNRFRPLIDAVQTAAIAAHGTGPASDETRAMLAAEQALRRALPYTAPSVSLPYLLRLAAVGHAAHLVAAGTPTALRCSCRPYCDSQQRIDEHRKALLTYGLAAGDPVAEVVFSRTTGTVSLKRLFVSGCGGPFSGGYLSGGVDRDTWGDQLTSRTTDVVDHLLLRQGWRVVTFAAAAAALTAAGFDVAGDCGERGRLHVLRPDETGPDRWRVTDPDLDEWTLRAIAVRHNKP